MTQNPHEAAWHLWGKARPTSEEGPQWHPLVCHMVDVASVFEVLAERHLPRVTLDRLLGRVGAERARALSWLAFVVALHDLGKATPSFQCLWDGGPPLLAPYGLKVRQYGSKTRLHHGATGTRLLVDLFQSMGVPRTGAQELAYAVASHHGMFCPSGDYQDAGRESQKGDSPWQLARDALVDELATLYGAHRAPEFHWQRDNGWSLLLAGIASVADWVGSMADIFTYEPPQRNLSAYRDKSLARAHQALDQVGWSPSRTATPRSFSQLFAHESWAASPRPLHIATEALTAGATSPCLLLIEAPMGEGKTEAALLASDHFAANFGATGLYVGLPTQATANQILGRVRRFLESSYAGVSQLHLVHGDAGLSEEYRQLMIKGIDGPDSTGANAVLAREWFARSKRALLADNAVGTIDQALLGTLWVRHGFVRLAGLAGKTVILDEVHAYDVYTGELLERLVAWLGTMGSSIVLLSATLPATRREALLKAYAAAIGAEVEACAPVRYPRMSQVGIAQQPTAIPLSTSQAPRSLQLELLPIEPDAVTAWLLDKLEAGGCAAWICNTVSRAQAAYEAIATSARDANLELDVGLLHSRMLRKDRLDREESAERLFGPPARAARPKRAVLVGTQVIEQSLDLDFDVMVSDIAPVDLALQRAGRLHRHSRGARPPSLQSAILGLCTPLDEIPSFREVARVYDEAVMLRSWQTLTDRSEITLPDDMEALVERVYGDTVTVGGSPDFLAALKAAEQERERQTKEHSSLAQGALIGRPNAPRAPWDNPHFVFSEEDDPNVHETVRALTRLAEPSVDLVCVQDGSVGGIVFEPRAEPKAQALRALLLHSMKLSSPPGLVHWLLQQHPPNGWRKHPALRHRRVALFDNNTCKLGRYTLRLHHELGLQVDS